MTAALVLPLENDSAVSREWSKEREREGGGKEKRRRRRRRRRMGI